MTPSPLALVLSRLENAVAEADSLTVALALWLGVGYAPAVSGPAAGLWVPRDVAIAGLLEAAGRTGPRPFAGGLASLRKREFFVPHVPGTFESDPLAILGVAVGVRHHGEQAAAPWIADIARRAREGESDSWRIALLGAAELVAGSDPASPLLPELTVALSAKGIGDFDPRHVDAARRAATELGNVSPDKAAVRLAVLAALSAREAASAKPRSIPAQRETVVHPSMAATSQEAQPLIGILTALPKECGAVQLMLQDVERLKIPGEGGGRDYYLGRVPAEGGGTHVVVLALLPDMGNNSGAIRATLLLQHFKTVRHIIMCGIAGGVPKPGERDHDVRLGDIVVSDRGGVVQYDLVKEKRGGWTEHRHPPRPPGAELLGAVRHLMTEEELGRYPWEQFIAIGSKLKNGQRPADGTDAQGGSITYPADSERRPGLPRVFHGTVAAANTLLKNPAHRDYLGDAFGVRAVEMEASGIADATWVDGSGYLIVRGICDYCDHKKGDVWQGAAAVAAAAYVRALLGSMLFEQPGSPEPRRIDGNTSHSDPRTKRRATPGGPSDTTKGVANTESVGSGLRERDLSALRASLRALPPRRVDHFFARLLDDRCIDFADHERFEKFCQVIERSDFPIASQTLLADLQRVAAAWRDFGRYSGFYDGDDGGKHAVFAWPEIRGPNVHEQKMLHDEALTTLRRAWAQLINRIRADYSDVDISAVPGDRPEVEAKSRRSRRSRKA